MAGLPEDLAGLGQRGALAVAAALDLDGLHGYHGSGAILRRQMAPLAAAIPAYVELVYVDAPIADFLAGFSHDAGAAPALDESRRQ